MEEVITAKATGIFLIVTKQNGDTLNDEWMKLQTISKYYDESSCPLWTKIALIKHTALP